ncbi:MAG: hypothetical protein JW800_06895 [Candidatus Omnitrophica bacterium]|nr:hypothetical protein [Candidatus Omnitrophota bacterium]
MQLEKFLQSRINRKIIKFFLENPSSIDTSRGIAIWINENIESTERALKQLVQANILVPHGTDATSAYGYTTDKKLTSRIRLSFKKLGDKKRNRYH